jgi:hypothetical protein
VGGKSQPDFGDVAASQGEENAGVVRDQLYANRPTQYTPWGYTDWQQQGGTDAQGNPITEWTQTQGLTPELQDILNKQIAIQGGRTDVAGMLTGRMGGEFGQQMDWRGLNPMGQRPTAQYTLPEGGIDDPYQTRQRAEDSVYNQAQSRIAPQQEGQKAALETKMRNQGLRPEDAAWKSQVQGMGQKHNDQNNQALWSANQAGLAESGQMYGQQMGMNQNAFNQALGANSQNFGQSMQGSQYANQIRQQQITEALTKRGSSLNEINALLSGQQVGMPQMPNFQGATAAAPAPLMQGAAQQASGANAANPMGGLMNLGGTLGAAAITASDRRLKTNIQRIGTKKGYPWYSYNMKYDGSAHEGVMADEIPQEHVIDMDGISLVNYGTLLGE